MHGEQNDIKTMEKSNAASYRKARRKYEERSNSCRPVVSGCAQHGERLENTVESAITKKAQSDRKKNMEGFRPSFNGKCNKAKEQNEEERLAPMGKCSGDYTKEICSKGQSNIKARRITTSNVLLLLKRQQYCCALTGRELTPQTAALDHILPIRCGGEHVIENVQVLHKDVNRAKGSMTNDEFIKLCDDVINWSNRPLD